MANNSKPVLQVMYFRKISARITLLILALLSWVVPKRPGLFVFYSIQFEGKYGGNLKPVFELMVERRAAECLWLAREEVTAGLVSAAGFPVARSKVSWLLPILRADWLVVDGIRSPLGFGRFKFIQLWHGTGLKRIGIENKNRGSLGKFLVTRFGEMTKLIIGSSSEDLQRKMSSLNCSSGKITGSPRTDVLVSGEMQDRVGRTILYVPTFRDQGWCAPPMSRQQWHELDDVLARMGWKMLVKRHPSDSELAVPPGLGAIFDVTGSVEDVQQSIIECDLVVSDYSGIVTDVAITGKPIVWYLPDLDDYLSRDREFYYEFPGVVPGPVAFDYASLLDCIANKTWEREDFRASYQTFVERFHQHRDGLSTLRVVDSILEVTG